jgi:hypothetical protein
MEIKNQTNQPWQKCDTNIFWGEIAPCEHVVQIYENDQVFMDLLEGYVIDGFKTGDCVILIITEAHRRELYQRLYARNLSLNELMLNKQFIVKDAEGILEKFMIQDWPDAEFFTEAVTGLIETGRKSDRPIRAFGEMVAILWARGLIGATMQLERLWNRFCQKEKFTLLCAYPRSGFNENPIESIMHICGKHTKMVASINESTAELRYRPATLKMEVI